MQRADWCLLNGAHPDIHRRRAVVLAPERPRRETEEGNVTAPATTFQEYDPKYPEAFARLSELIRSALPSARVEHVGSTSVPGLGGRRTLDAVILAMETEQQRWASAVRQLGFTDAAFAWTKPMLTGTVEYQGSTYAVLLYFVSEGHGLYRGWVAFRDYLREHPDEASRYATVKRDALASGRTTPWDYQKAKTPYLQSIASQIESEQARERSP
ncbi:MAG: hypothetical protein NVS3B18_04690 [Candidatus Dormibacteria bacterium]